MKIKYDQDADVLYMIISDAPPVDAIEEQGGVIISFGEDGNPVSIEFLNASEKNLVREGEVSVSFTTIY